MIRGFLSANRFFVFVSLFGADEESFSVECTYSALRATCVYSVNSFRRNKWDLPLNISLKKKEIKTLLSTGYFI